MKLTLQEVELLATLLQRAGVTPIEAMWANMVLNKIRQLVVEGEKAEAVLALESDVNRLKQEAVAVPDVDSDDVVNTTDECDTTTTRP